MPRLPAMLGYILSLPERIVRAAAAGLGGLLYEAMQVLLPGWIRRSRLYQAIVAGTLRLTIELLGGARGILPPDEVTARELAVRKAASTGIELAGLLAMGWSPLWLFAATADLTGGTRTYLRALVSELQRDGLLYEGVAIASVAELLDSLEGSSGRVAESLDVPPLNVDDMRASWQDLRQHATELPDAPRLAGLYAGLQQVAEQEGRSLRSVSSLIAAGALRAGVKMGQVHIFDYYQDALRAIDREGLPAYGRRVTRPYLAVARRHFDARRLTHTERLVGRLRRAHTSAGATRNRRQSMKILVAYYSETGNTAKVAGAIGEILSTEGHKADLMPLGEIAADTLSAYDLVFLGSACHDADLARPVKQLLAQIPSSPAFKLAGFVTHAAYTPEGGERERQVHETWASRCALSFRQASQEKGFDFLGYFGCQGAPSPPIEQFIHNTIVTDDDEWQEYVEEVRRHPDEDDLREAREFARTVVARV